MMTVKHKRFFVIDGSSLVYRAFHAIPKTLATSGGLPTNAIYGFTQTLLKIIRDFSPDYIAVAFDSRGPTFRHGVYAEYKAERPPMPELLSVQIPYIKKVVEALGIKMLEMESVEADDIIAALVKEARKRDLKSCVITGDKDLYQLVDKRTVILDYLSSREYGPGDVEERFGVGPRLVREVMALAGDPSDNIPGVPGIGIKTAAKLIKKYGSLEGLYEQIDEVSGKLRKKLIEYRDQAFLSRELATLHEDVPAAFDPADFRLMPPDVEKVAPLFMHLEFEKMLKEIIARSGRERAAGDFQLVDSDEAEKALAENISRAKRISVTLLADDRPGPFISIRGAAAATGRKKAFFIPAGRATAGLIKKILVKKTPPKATDSAKRVHLFCLGEAIEAAGIDMDTTIASYLLNPSRPEHTVEGLALTYLKTFTPEPSEGDIMEGERWRDVCKKACNILEISDLFNKMLAEQGLEKLFRSIELPLAAVLASMEFTGIKVDRSILEALSRELEIQKAHIGERIYRAAGGEFNLNSPKQLSEVLFKRLGLRPVKKTKTGYSTNEEVLRKLAAEHEVPGLILEYRAIAKLKSTYVDALTGLIDPATGRIHTSFNQTVTATGRLSSSSPNLQNIPVRGDIARRIREAFVPEKGFSFLAADYSQIELRLVAHMSGDPGLIEAFKKGEDIHARTAREIFGLKRSAEVTPEMRRRAKAINFGIIYGMGPYGLAAELGISIEEAAAYIDSYFSHYCRVRDFIEKTIEDARERGYTTTLFGRRRYIPELASPDDQTRRFGMRLAVNTPVQGSAADIIKAAMVRIHGIFTERALASRMLLQIHDELLFEVHRDEKSPVSRTVREVMEGVVQLSVPIKVNLKTGPNWGAVEPLQEIKT